MNDYEIKNPQPAPASNSAHSLTAVERREVQVRGVREVLSFDETHVRLVTSSAILTLEGRDLRIHVLNTRDGAVAVTGTLDGLLYEDSEPEGGSSQGASARLKEGSTRRRLFR